MNALSSLSTVIQTELGYDSYTVYATYTKSTKTLHIFSNVLNKMC